jgi:serine kinase of HPr protein (carbohydrate metabolism regulator)
MAAATVHASCVVVGEAGILIRGPSGSGKSRLAREILAAAGASTFARLVCDDRVHLENRSGRLLARAVPAIAGRIEMRGVGLLAVPYEPAAVVRLVVDASSEHGERLPQERDDAVDVCGVTLPRITGTCESLAAAALWQVNVIMTG